MRSWTLLGCAALACTFESSSPVADGMSGDSTSGAGGSTSVGATDPSTPSVGAGSGMEATDDVTGEPVNTSDDPTTADTSTSSSSGEGDSADEASSSESTGEPSFVLSDEDLVARYFLDEAAEGMVPTLALDVGEEPVDLPLDYAESTMHYVEEGGQRGLGFDVVGADDAARIDVADTKLDGVEGVTALTIEVVLRLEDAVSAGSRIFHVGHNDSSTVALAASSAQELEARWNNSVVRTWDYTGFAGAPHVVHLVIDTTAANEASQFRLLVDGTELEPRIESSIDANEPASLASNAIFALGNRHQDRSIRGALFYAAIYGATISGNRIAQHVSRLQLSDDT